MRPRRGRRGNLAALFAAVWSLSGLQGDRAGEGAEIVSQAVGELAKVMLQGDRAGEGAEISGRMTGKPQPRGFNETAPVKARK